MNTVRDEMMKRYIKETANRGNNNVSRRENADNIKKNKLEVFDHKKSEKERIIKEKKKI